MSLSAFSVALLLLVFIALASGVILMRQDKHNLPPGPKGFPILGNIQDLPTKKIPKHNHWIKHNKEYSPITSVTIMGQTLVVIHNKIIANEILNKRARGSSSRPIMEFANNLYGISDFFALQPFDKTYRCWRKIAHQYLNTQTMVKQYQTIQYEESRKSLLRIFNRPGELMRHLKKFSASIILKTTHGYSPEPVKADPLVTLIEHILDYVIAAFVPMKWAVDFIPALKYLPSNFPGAGFKKTAEQWKATCQSSAHLPYSFTVQQMKDGIDQPSYVAEAIGYDPSAITQELADDVMWTAVSLYAGGTETTASALITLVLAMIMFPEVQEKAQEEIDHNVGSGRLPTFDDQKKLPYIDRVVLEMYRWFPILPMCIPHRTDEDITYENVHIPKGSFIMPAIWGICHDPEVYPNPDQFDPDRYTGDRNEPDPRDVIFGFGRRICPGRYLADSSLFIAVAHILTVFKIGKATGEDDVEIDVQRKPKLSDLPQLTNSLESFPYKITLRDECYRDIIQSIGSEDSWACDSSHLE